MWEIPVFFTLCVVLFCASDVLGSAFGHIFPNKPAIVLNTINTFLPNVHEALFCAEVKKNHNYSIKKHGACKTIIHYFLDVKKATKR